MKTVVNKRLFGCVVILMSIFACSLGAEEKLEVAMTMSGCGDAGGKVILKDKEFRDQGIWYCDIEVGTRFQCIGQSSREANCNLHDDSELPRH